MTQTAVYCSTWYDSPSKVLPGCCQCCSGVEACAAPEMEHPCALVPPAVALSAALAAPRQRRTRLTSDCAALRPHHHAWLSTDPPASFQEFALSKPTEVLFRCQCPICGTISDRWRQQGCTRTQSRQLSTHGHSQPGAVQACLPMSAARSCCTFMVHMLVIQATLGVQLHKVAGT